MKKQIKYSTILVEAKKYLRKPKQEATYKSPFLCDAIMTAAHDLRARSQGLILTGKICLAIDKHFSVATWLEHKHNIDPRSITQQRLQEYRHRWLGHMIKTFKEAGQ